MEMNDTTDKYVLTVNAGSSSIKLAVFHLDNPAAKLFEATVANIGQDSVQLTANDRVQSVSASDHSKAAEILFGELDSRLPVSNIVAAGHRVVHGGPKYYETQAVTQELITDLQMIVAFDPIHLPVELKLLETLQRLLPDAAHFACFDTAFHHDLPAKASLLPIPRRFEEEGIKRYGFHGLSYSYILEELKRVEGDAAANGKVIIAHLGSGASLTALHKGKPIDTTMSMTPASGIPMSTRSGDLDPGLVLYFAKTYGYDIDQFNSMINFESGLLGISETSADMKLLLEAEANDDRAKNAVDIFCYNVRKNIGGLAAALGGLNTLVFTGGMGENAPKVRSRVCDELDFLGITLDTERNDAGSRLISMDGSPVGVHVIHTDEATTIAREVTKLINHH